MKTNTHRSATKHVPAAFAWLLLLAGVGAPAGAQPMMPNDGAIHSSFTARYSYSSQEDVERGGQAGEVDVASYGFSADVIVPLANDFRLLAGIAWADTELGLTGPVALPENLKALKLELGLSKEFAPGWTARVQAAPGFAADSSSFSSDSFGVSGGLIVTRKMSPQLSWSLGLIASSRGDNPVLPVAALFWRWAPDWTLAIGVPITGVIYQFTPQLSFELGAGVQGGTYYVEQARGPGLGDTYLDYREIRGGVGATYRFGGNYQLKVEAGAVIDRNFDYYDRNYELEGDGGTYGTVSLGMRF